VENHEKKIVPAENPDMFY